MAIKKPSSILPGNTPGALSPVIPVEYTNTAPVALIVKNTAPYRIPTTPDALPLSSEDVKEVDAKKFPILRGFA